MKTQEPVQAKLMYTEAKLDSVATSILLRTLDPIRALSVITQEEGSGSPILALDYSTRFAFVLHHVLGYRIEEAAVFAKLSEEQFRWLLRDAYTQLAASYKFYAADFVVELASA